MASQLNVKQHLSELEEAVSGLAGELNALKSETKKAIPPIANEQKRQAQMFSNFLDNQ